jgi:hypothetical protein
MERVERTGEVVKIDLREDPTAEAAHFILIAYPAMQEGEIEYHVLPARSHTGGDGSVTVAKITTGAWYPGSHEDWLRNVRDRALAEIDTSTLRVVDPAKAPAPAKPKQSGPTVKIYTVTVYSAYLMSEQGTTVGLSPWGLSSGYYHGEDDGGRDYLLPEGYTVERDTGHVPHIYNGRGAACSLERAGEKVILIDPAIYPRHITLTPAHV